MSHNCARDGTASTCSYVPPMECRHPKNTVLARCAMRLIRENKPEERMTEVIEKLETGAMDPSKMCEKLVEPLLQNADGGYNVTFNDAVEMVGNMSAGCKKHAAAMKEYEDQGALPPAGSGALLEREPEPVFTAEYDGEQCGEAELKVYKAMVSPEEKQMYADEHVHIRRMRRRRARRALIEKRRALEASDSKEVAVAGNVNAAGACITLNGEQYCKDMNKVQEQTHAEKVRKLQDYYEERGVEIFASMRVGDARMDNSHPIVLEKKSARKLSKKEMLKKRSRLFGRKANRGRKN